MKDATVEIPVSVLSSIETLGELRQARADDVAGKFKEWKPRHVS